MKDAPACRPWIATLKVRSVGRQIPVADIEVKELAAETGRNLPNSI